MKKKTYNILLVEDSSADIILTKRTIRKIKINVNFHIIEDGSMVLPYLQKSAEFSRTDLPDLIILDLKLPKLNGLDVLKKIKEDPKLKVIPVIIFSASNLIEDVKKCYENYANAFITKPIDLEEFEKIIISIKNFYFGVVSLPNHYLF